MANGWLAGAWACALAAAWAGVQAQPLPAPARCEPPAHAGPPILGRQERIAQYEALGEQCLKQLTVACSDAASRRLLDADNAFACSIGYEALLRRGFGGDFHAMLAWWRSLGSEAPRGD